MLNIAPAKVTHILTLWKVMAKGKVNFSSLSRSMKALLCFFSRINVSMIETKMGESVINVGSNVMVPGQSLFIFMSFVYS